MTFRGFQQQHSNYDSILCGCLPKSQTRMRALLGNDWLVHQWNLHFILDCKLSIEYLELYALAAGIITWQDHPQLQNSWVSVHCDNESVVHMISNTASSCSKCMKLIRILVLNNIVHNRRLFTQHIRSEDNFLTDSLSRLNFKCFWH